MNQLKINKEKRFSSFFDQINELRKIDFLVLHHIEAISVNHAIEQFLKHKVSSRYQICGLPVVIHAL